MEGGGIGGAGEERFRECLLLALVLYISVYRVDIERALSVVYKHEESLNSIISKGERAWPWRRHGTSSSLWSHFVKKKKTDDYLVIMYSNAIKKACDLKEKDG